MAAYLGRPGIGLAWNYVDLDASDRLLTVGQMLTLLSFERPPGSRRLSLLGERASRAP